MRAPLAGCDVTRSARNRLCTRRYAPRTPTWRRSRHPSTKLVQSLAPRSGREQSQRQAQRAASQPGGGAAIQAQKIFKKIAKVHQRPADNIHVLVYLLH